MNRKRLYGIAYRRLCDLYSLTPDLKSMINNAAMWCWDRSDGPGTWRTF